MHASCEQDWCDQGQGRPRATTETVRLRLFPPLLSLRLTSFRALPHLAGYSSCSSAAASSAASSSSSSSASKANCDPAPQTRLDSPAPTYRRRLPLILRHGADQDLCIMSTPFEQDIVHCHRHLHLLTLPRADNTGRPSFAGASTASCTVLRDFAADLLPQNAACSLARPPRSLVPWLNSAPRRASAASQHPHALLHHPTSFGVSLGCVRSVPSAPIPFANRPRAEFQLANSLCVALISTLSPYDDSLRSEQ